MESVQLVAALAAQWMSRVDRLQVRQAHRRSTSTTPTQATERIRKPSEQPVRAASRDQGPSLVASWLVREGEGLSDRAGPSPNLWLRGGDLNPRPLGYEPNELPDCSTPRHVVSGTRLRLTASARQAANCDDPNGLSVPTGTFNCNTRANARSSDRAIPACSPRVASARADRSRPVPMDCHSRPRRPTARTSARRQRR